jgi:GntR family transcriptional regulator/MocR family aminotransferase
MIVLENNGKPLGLRLYDAITEAILSGRYAAEDRLPSTRELSARLGISRNSANAAYERLEAEGYVTVKAASGTFVARGARLTGNRMRPRKEERIGFGVKRHDVIDFKSGLPDGHLFPVERWSRTVASVLKSATPSDFGYGWPEGRIELREAISAYLNRFRSTRCTAEDILVTAGTTQAVGIAGRILLSERRSVAFVEDPLTSDIKSILSHEGGRPHPLRVDTEGIDPAAIPDGPAPALVYVTPSHQYPTGSSMPIQRKLALVRYAASSGCVIIEDDYDSEFRYDGPPLPSIQGLDPERVVYIGTFSKTLSPAFRTAYMVLPPRLMKSAREAKWLLDLHNPLIDQLALAAFIREGHYARHIARMRRVYRARRGVLVSTISERAAARGISAEILGGDAGMHLVARFPGTRFTKTALSALETAGTRVYPVSAHSLIPRAWEDSLILGYGSLSEEEIRKGVEIIISFVSSQAASARPRGTKRDHSISR